MSAAAGRTAGAGLALPLYPGPLVDGLSRPISYLRVSLTDRCNYRCTYCMPPEGINPLPRSELLTFEEIVTVVAVLQQVGVRRVRLTGGEPTVRKDLVVLVSHLARLGLDDLALSTNGERLAELAGPLRQAGLGRLNISLDTLDAARFAQVTRHGHLDRVLAGIEAARAAGFACIKLNTVAVAGFNDDELPAICRFAWARGLVPRFIEIMPMSGGALFYPGSLLPAARIRALLEEAFGPGEPGVTYVPGAGPARYLQFRVEGKPVPVGIISAVTEPFCDTCNRVRLSATGQLHVCLAHDESTDLRTVLRSGLRDAELAAALLAAVRGAVAAKRAGHAFTRAGCGGPRKHMVSIGG
ncbi:MAG: GTP 3',8-cyclase MoaA [Myxococcales bacterium]|nr:GTP 3',8-cyclase MoaA [Myxococcales bacterium]